MEDIITQRGLDKIKSGLSGYLTEEEFEHFKQKTAYEMRESDWSSDVCSSDLYGNHALCDNAISRNGR